MEIFKKIDDLIVKNFTLEQLNYNHLDYMKDYNTGIFYNENDDKINALSYGYGYDYRDYDPIIMNQDSFGSWISFKNIEKILDYALYNQTNDKTFHNSNEFYINHKKTIFNSEAQNVIDDHFFCEIYKDKKLLINDILEGIKQANIFIEKYHLPFFEKFSTLQDLNDKIIEKYDSSEWHIFFNENTNLKAIIIMKLCENKKYSQFAANYKLRVYKGIQEQNRNDLIPLYETITRLIDYLDMGEYKNLDT